VDLPDPLDLSGPFTVRHARPAALDELEPMLVELRALRSLKERSRGTFYRGGKAFLHFHEDPSGHHVDVRLDQDFERFRVQTKAEQQRVVTLVRKALTSGG
jgi:hypothetical protein